MANSLQIFTHLTHLPHRLKLFVSLVGGMLLLWSFACAATQGPQTRTGVFLVATPQLHGTSFQETVILVTHYSEQGATGLAINRPSDIPLHRAFPSIRQLQQKDDPLYLGGPVSQNAVFILSRTKSPVENMRHIVDDIYFTAGSYANADILAMESRVFAGYAGWAPGQLQNEVDHGDWIIVHTNPEIIFAEDLENLWADLFKAWSGTWL